MANLKIYIESTYKGPARKDGVAMYLIEWMKDDIPITRQGFCHQIDGTETQACLKALINAFHLLKKPCETLITTSCRSIFNALNNDWLSSWQQNEWKTAKGEEVKNKDLWLMFLDKTSLHSYSIETGHHEYRNVMQTELSQEFERWKDEQKHNSSKNRTV